MPSSTPIARQLDSLDDYECAQSPPSLSARVEDEIASLGFGYDAPASPTPAFEGSAFAPVAPAPAGAANTLRAVKARKIVTAGSKRWCFTLNNPSAEDYSAVGGDGWGVFGLYQLELAPTTGTPHLQGAVVFATAQRLSALRKLHARASWSVMRDLDRSIVYCSDDSKAAVPFVRKRWGTLPVGQGTRTDIHEAADIVLAGGVAALAQSMPHMIIRYPAGLRYLEQLRPVVPEVVAPPVWRPWQQGVLDLLATEPDDRTIHWYVDSDGGQGKSTLVRAVTGTGQPCSAISLSGKVADMALAYTRERCVFFDISRTMAENVRHLADFAEKLKNGMIFSTKYESRVKMFRPPHVIFFSNSPPEPGLWSADRLRLTVLGAPAPAFAAVSVPKPALAPMFAAMAGAGAAALADTAMDVERLCVECMAVPAKGSFSRCEDCM
uniref:Replication-associated protein n=1 Tax=Cressdnaviricota sp. TaxID=2748378 RepID=A0A890UPS3_9VIRU|nr:MAG: replication-associated protein [Cressdnaviricota sp.]